MKRAVFPEDKNYNACNEGRESYHCGKGCVRMDQVKIGRLIAETRREQGITQRELAERLGVSNRTVSKWECGDGLPELMNLLPLCEALGLTADELLRGERTQ